MDQNTFTGDRAGSAGSVRAGLGCGAGCAAAGLHPDGFGGAPGHEFQPGTGD